MSFSMFAELTQWIIDQIRQYGVWGMIVGVLIESIIVPIPSPIIGMTGGFVLIEQTLPLGAALFKMLWLIAIPTAAAAVVGSYLPYYVAYIGGKPLLTRYRRFIGISWDEITSMKRKLAKKQNLGLTIFLLRAIPIMPLSVISATAGVLKTDVKKYSLFSFLGIIPRNMFYAFLGWKMAGVFHDLAKQLDSMETALTLLLVAALLFWLLNRKFKIIEAIQKKVQKLFSEP
ncbi:hypothetical protein COY95_00585 [Candidatus Woesearchaeota archaeon CG_4_10_14_0_8_um_filter_47_5]|nr:MAG: hypothetical protein COY95_00585 [Candidatus Woesearchaeota archaeon CG_4_10_14_0_8_um_filter_47_5]